LRKCAEVYYSGRVHGVGFRFTAQNISSKYSISGHVKNLYDGRVEIIAEGEKKEVESFLEAVYKAMEPNIDKFSINWFEFSGRFNGFSVEY